MSHAIIASIYEAKLIVWSKARAEPIKVVFENVQYDPADGETCLRAFLLSGDTASSTLAGDHRAFIGVYQVSIVAPANTGKTKTNPLVPDRTGGATHYYATTMPRGPAWAAKASPYLLQGCAVMTPVQKLIGLGLAILLALGIGFGGA